MLLVKAANHTNGLGHHMVWFVVITNHPSTNHLHGTVPEKNIWHCVVVCPSKTKFARSFSDMIGHPASLRIPLTVHMKVLQQVMNFSHRQDTSGHYKQSFICTAGKSPTHVTPRNISDSTTYILGAHFHMGSY